MLRSSVTSQYDLSVEKWYSIKSIIEKERPYILSDYHSVNANQYDDIKGDKIIGFISKCELAPNKQGLIIEYDLANNNLHANTAKQIAKYGIGMIFFEMCNSKISELAVDGRILESTLQFYCLVVKDREPRLANNGTSWHNSDDVGVTWNNTDWVLKNEQ